MPMWETCSDSGFLFYVCRIWKPAVYLSEYRQCKLFGLASRLNGDDGLAGAKSRNNAGLVYNRYVGPTRLKGRNDTRIACGFLGFKFRFDIDLCRLTNC